MNKIRKKLRREERTKRERERERERERAKRFYSYIRSKQKVKAGMSRIDRGDGSMTESDKETADILCSYFKSVFVKEDQPLPDFKKRCREATYWVLHTSLLYQSHFSIFSHPTLNPHCFCSTPLIFW